MKCTSFTSLLMGILLTLSNFCIIAQPRTEWKSFHEQMEIAQVIGYQALVVKNGQTYAKVAQGLQNIHHNDLINDSTVFVLASLSKPIIALGIMQLVEREVLVLDEPINIYLPFVISHPHFPDSIITPRMLLAHTSCILDNWEVLNQLYRPDSPIQYELTLETFLRKYFLESGTYYYEHNFHPNEPGKHFDYSNVGYMLLGYLIERITQKRLKDYCKEEIFEPLGMRHTYWYRQDIPHNNIATPHLMEENKHITLPHFGFPSYPEGQIRSTVSDYAKLILMFLHQGMIHEKQFLQPETVKEFLRIQYPSQNPWQAIAWNLNEFGDEEFYKEVPHTPAHTGLDPGSTTAVLFDTDKQAAAIIFNNTEPVSFAPLLRAMTILVQMAEINIE